VVVDSLKVLDPKRPIREADFRPRQLLKSSRTNSRAVAKWFLSGSASNLHSTDFPRPVIQSLPSELKIKFDQAKDRLAQKLQSLDRWVTNFNKLEMGDYNGKELTKMAYRQDAILLSTPSHRIRPWKSAAPPADIQNVVYSGGIRISSNASEPAKAPQAFLSAPAAAPVIRKNGMDASHPCSRTLSSAALRILALFSRPACSSSESSDSRTSMMPPRPTTLGKDNVTPSFL
jgi:hypothetical protein